MKQIILIGNLVRDPEMRTTQSGVSVCTFTVAVNGRKQEDANFFRVSAWRQLGENCNRFLAKGHKVAVMGVISLQTYTDKDGHQRASMEVNAQEVEFLTPKQEPVDAAASNDGFVQVEDDDLPF